MGFFVARMGAGLNSYPIWPKFLPPEPQKYGNFGTMSRARHPRSLALSGLTWNMATGKYDITEGNITYSMPLESTRSLKNSFINNAACRSVADWYAQLEKTERALVIRIGDLPKEPDDFTPDPIWE